MGEPKEERMTAEERYTGRGSEKMVAAELMGRVVECSAKFEKIQDGNKVHHQVVELQDGKSIVGWVVGIRRLPIGSWEKTAWEEEGATEFQVTGTVTALLVSPWVNRRPVRVPLGSFQCTDHHPRSGLSWKDQGVPDDVRDSVSEELRKDANEQPRIGGRFVTKGTD